MSAYAEDIMVSISGQNEIDKLVDILNSYGTFSAALYLLKEEGGQGIVDFKSRKAAFRLLFVQKFLYKLNVSLTGLTF